MCIEISCRILCRISTVEKETRIGVGKIVGVMYDVEVSKKHMRMEVRWASRRSARLVKTCAQHNV